MLRERFKNNNPIMFAKSNLGVLRLCYSVNSVKHFSKPFLKHVLLAGLTLNKFRIIRLLILLGYNNGNTLFYRVISYIVVILAIAYSTRDISITCN